jgi:hypothetical protein
VSGYKDIDTLREIVPDADYCREKIAQAQAVVDDPDEYPREYLGDARRQIARYTKLLNAAPALSRVREALEAAEDAAATHHGQWRTRITSGGNEHVPTAKLERLRAALRAVREGAGE